MKKLTALILTLVMLLSMTAIVPVSAEANVLVLTPDETEITVDAGQDLELVWDLNEDLAWFNMVFTMTYDSSVFEFDDESSLIYGDSYLKYMSYTHNPDIANEVTTLVKVSKAGNFYDVLSSKDQGKFPADVFYYAYFTVAEDAPTGDYEFKLVDVSSTNYAGDKNTVAPIATIVVHVNGVESEPEVPAGPAIAVDGVQLREPLPNGVEPAFGARFVSTADYVEGYEYGTVVIPTDLLEGDLTVETANAAVVPADRSLKIADDKVTFNATMIRIKDENLTRDFTVVSYVKDAEGAYTYAEAYTVNVKAAADAFMADETNSAAAKDYVQRKVLDKLA